LDLAATVFLLAAIRLVGERWWGTTLLVFAPRRFFLYPLVPLAALVVWSRRWRLVPVLLATAVLIAGPMMGLAVPWRTWLAPTPGGPRLRILTLNGGGVPLDHDALNALIAREAIDVVCFQELFGGPGITRRVAPGFSWNLDRRIASRFPIVHESRPEIERCPDDTDLASRLPIVTIRLPDGPPVRIAVIDTPSMTGPFAELRAGRLLPDLLREATACRRAYAGRVAEALGRVRGPLILAGDFNAPPDSDLVAPFRAAYADAFRQAGLGYGYSWSRAHPFLRLDRVLGSAHWSFTRCEVGPAVGSDHLPVWAEAVLVEGTP
jgi:endonuclease/exonuclease/phosphatase (EEP) superfamily protein YafD